MHMCSLRITSSTTLAFWIAMTAVRGFSNIKSSFYDDSILIPLLTKKVSFPIVVCTKKVRKMCKQQSTQLFGIKKPTPKSLCWSKELQGLLGWVTSIFANINILIFFPFFFLLFCIDLQEVYANVPLGFISINL